MQYIGRATAVVVRMVMAVVAVPMPGFMSMVRVIRATVGLGPVHRVSSVTVSHTRSRRQRRQAGNRQHQHPAQQLVEDPFHVSRTLVSKGVTPR